MRCIHIDLAYTKGISGGDRCTLETVRYLAKQGIPNILVTTVDAKENYVGLGLEESGLVQYQTIPDCGGDGGALNILQAYIRRVPPARRLVLSLPIASGDTLICHNEFLPNRMAMKALTSRFPRIGKIYWIHMIAPRLFRGYLGEFTGTFHWPTLRLIRYRLEQYFYRRTIPKNGLILTHNPWYRETLEKWFPENRMHILSHYGGVDVPQMDVDKKYDLVWCGRFHAQKGLPELVNIVEHIKAKKPDVTLALIGSGDRNIERKLDRLIAAKGLKENIIRTGYLDGAEKFRTLQQARVFVMPSWFESFGQVNLEAMKCGLPVVAYDLPVYGVFKQGMVKVPVRDNVRMAAEILRLLNDQQAYDQLRAAALAFSSEFSWDKTGEETLSLIQSL